MVWCSGCMHQISHLTSLSSGVLAASSRLLRPGHFWAHICRLHLLFCCKCCQNLPMLSASTDMGQVYPRKMRQSSSSTGYERLVQHCIRCLYPRGAIERNLESPNKQKAEVRNICRTKCVPQPRFCQRGLQAMTCPSESKCVPRLRVQTMGLSWWQTKDQTAQLKLCSRSLSLALFLCLSSTGFFRRCGI